jgi:DNA (cytosine-5)-methyltransferase 1
MEKEISRTIKVGGGYPLPTNTKLGYDIAEERNDGIRLEHPKSKTARGRVIKGASQSLKTSAQVGVIDTVPYVRNPYNGKQSETETGTIGTSVGTSTGKTAQLLHKDLRIRRLTPTECERLQGFPDGWTEYGIDEKGEEVEISDTQRYKCLGNAVTVNVVYEVARRLNE